MQEFTIISCGWDLTWSLYIGVFCKSLLLGIVPCPIKILLSFRYSLHKQLQRLHMDRNIVIHVCRQSLSPPGSDLVLHDGKAGAHVPFFTSS